MFNQVFICETPYKASSSDELMEVDMKPEPNIQEELIQKPTKLEFEDVKTKMDYLDKKVIEKSELKPDRELLSQSMKKCASLEQSEDEIKVLTKQSYSSVQDDTGNNVITNSVDIIQPICDPLEESHKINANDFQKTPILHGLVHDLMRQGEKKIENLLGKQQDISNLTYISNKNRYILSDIPPTGSILRTVLQRENCSALNEKQHCNGSDRSISANSCGIASPMHDNEDGDDSCSDWEQEYFFSKDRSKAGTKKQEQKNQNVISVNNKHKSLGLAKINNISKKGYLSAQNQKQTTGKDNKLIKPDRDLRSKIFNSSNKIEKQKANSKINNSFKIKSVPNVFHQHLNKNENSQQTIFEELCKQQNINGKQNYKNITVPKVTQPKDITENSEGNVEEAFVCNICSNWFTSKSRLSRHTKYTLCSGYKTKKTHQCNMCGKLFNSFQKLLAHENTHVQARPYKCFDCEKCFNSKSTRLMHHKKIHKNIRMLYLCCYCGITSVSIKHILAHEDNHRLPEGTEIPTPFKCLKCGKGFISQFKLTTHKREHNMKKCSLCSKEFLTDAPLREHMDKVHGIVKTYSCDICSNTFKTSGTLRCHKTSHSTVLSFFCDICDKGFKQKNHIEQHMITHSDERPISCIQCDETFKRKTHLKQHITSAHEGCNKRKSAIKKVKKV